MVDAPFWHADHRPEGTSGGKVSDSFEYLGAYIRKSSDVNAPNYTVKLLAGSDLSLPTPFLLFFHGETTCDSRCSTLKNPPLRLLIITIKMCGSNKMLPPSLLNYTI